MKAFLTELFDNPVHARMLDEFIKAWEEGVDNLEQERKAKRKTEMDKLKDMFDKAYEADEKEIDARIAGMCRDNKFWDERPSFVYKRFSIHDELRKKDQRIMNTMMRDLVYKATCAPKEKTFPIGNIGGECGFEIGQKVSIEGQVFTLVSDEDFNRVHCFAASTDSKTPGVFDRVPKEKTYSQADMDLAHKSNDFLIKELSLVQAENARLVSEKLRMQKCFEANNEILENTTDELKESQAENELLRATVQSLLNSDKGNSKPCETVGKGS